MKPEWDCDILDTRDSENMVQWLQDILRAVWASSDHSLMPAVCWQTTWRSNCGTGTRSGAANRCSRATPTTWCRSSSIPRTTTPSPRPPSTALSRWVSVLCWPPVAAFFMGAVIDFFFFFVYFLPLSCLHYLKLTSPVTSCFVFFYWHCIKQDFLLLLLFFALEMLPIL